MAQPALAWTGSQGDLGGMNTMLARPATRQSGHLVSCRHRAAVVIAGVLLAACSGGAIQGSPAASQPAAPQVDARASVVASAQGSIRISPMGNQPVPHDDPGAPVVASGTIVDESNRPRGGASVFLTLDPSQPVGSGLKAGDTLPAVGIVWTESNADGTFALHLRPTDAIAAVASANGGFAGFEIDVFDPYPTNGPMATGMWAVSLTLDGDRFTDVPDAPITLVVYAESDPSSNP